MFLLLALMAVAVLVWTAGFHTFVCTSSVRVSVNEVQQVEQGPFVRREVAVVRTAEPTGGAPPSGHLRCGHRDFESGVNLTDTASKHMFRANSPLSDGDLIARSAYFRPRPEVVNPLKTDYIIDPAGVCRGPEGAPYVLVMIPSLSYHTAVRQTIRHTWGSVVRAPWPGTRNLPRLKIVFVFGRTRMEEEGAVLAAESREHGDVLYVDFLDSYRNLTYKSLTSLHWASTRCAGARFFMKVDEDTFVNVPYLMDFLRYHERDVRRAVMGYAISRPVSVRTGKWAVGFDAYPLPVFPRYVFGHSYVITSDLIRELVDASRTIPFIPVEDALVTGVLAHAVNATRLHNPMFALARRSHTCAVVRNVKLTLTMISPASHEQLWDAVVKGECSYTFFPSGKTKRLTHRSK